MGDTNSSSANVSSRHRLTPAQSARNAISQGIAPNNHIVRPRHNSLSTEQSLIAFRPCFRTDEEAKEASAAAEGAKTDRDEDEKTLEKLTQKLKPPNFSAKFRSAAISLNVVPSCDELVGIAKRAFPEPMKIPVFICDIKNNDAQLSETRVGNVEQYWQEMPAGVHVRWIHIPLGTGILQSSLEDMFLHAGPDDRPDGFPFENAGLTGFPYLELDCLHLQSTEYLQHMKNVFTALKEKTYVNKVLNDAVLEGDANQDLDWDVRWRLKQLGKRLEYWNFVTSDLPHQLSEGVTLSDNGPLRPANILDHDLDQPSASSSELLEGANLVVAPFRCFHRGDGMLLTMSAATGVDYLDKNFREHIRETVYHRLKNPVASVVGSLRAMLTDNGAKHWPHKTVEEFLVYLVTELGMTPHNMRSGRNAPSLLSVFHCEVQEIKMKRRRYKTWEPNDAMELVERSLLCLDNLNAIKLSYERKLAFFRRLEKDIIQMEMSTQSSRAAGQDQDVNSNAPPVWTCRRRIKLVQRYLEREKANAEHLIDDLTQVNNTLYQIKTLEQNELAIKSDSQNRAILVFTGVTVIFLPMSFFTSYFGMSFRGVAKSRYGEGLFWIVSLPSTVLIFLVVAVGVVYADEISSWVARTPRPVPQPPPQKPHETPPEV